MQRMSKQSSNEWHFFWKLPHSPIHISHNLSLRASECPSARWKLILNNLFHRYKARSMKKYSTCQCRHHLAIPIYSSCSHTHDNEAQPKQPLSTFKAEAAKTGRAGAIINVVHGGAWEVAKQYWACPNIFASANIFNKAITWQHGALIPPSKSPPRRFCDKCGECGGLCSVCICWHFRLFTLSRWFSRGHFEQFWYQQRGYECCSSFCCRDHDIIHVSNRGVDRMRSCM